MTTDTVKERLFLEKLLNLMDVYGVTGIYPDVMHDGSGKYTCHYVDINAKDFEIELTPDDKGYITPKSIRDEYYA